MPVEIIQNKVPPGGNRFSMYVVGIVSGEVETIGDVIEDGHIFCIQSIKVSSFGADSMIFLYWRSGDPYSDYMFDSFSVDSAESNVETYPDYEYTLDDEHMIGDGSTTRLIIKRYCSTSSNIYVRVNGYTK